MYTRKLRMLKTFSFFESFFGSSFIYYYSSCLLRIKERGVRHSFSRLFAKIFLLCFFLSFLSFVNSKMSQSLSSFFFSEEEAHTRTHT